MAGEGGAPLHIDRRELVTHPICFGLIGPIQPASLVRPS
jgi:hypothetical protein